MVFGAAEYSPNSNTGQRLLAHELTHVVQQRDSSRLAKSAVIQRQAQPAVGAPKDAGTEAGVPPGNTPPVADGKPVGHAAAPQAPVAPEIRQGSLGDVEIHLGNYRVMERQEIEPLRFHAPATAELPAIPIPELPSANIKLTASVAFDTAFGAGFGPIELTDIRVGLSWKQIAEILGLSIVALPLAGPAIAGLGLLGLLRYGALSDVRGVANLKIPMDAFAHISVGGQIKAAGRVATLEVVSGTAGLAASADVRPRLLIGGVVGLYLDHGRLRFHLTEAASLTVDAALKFEAFLKASVLWTNWEYRWHIIDWIKQIHYGADVNLIYSNGFETKTLKISPLEDMNNAIGFLKEIFMHAAPSTDVKKDDPNAPDKIPDTAPTGRTRADPIAMTWAKPQAEYPTPINLEGERYYRSSRQRLAGDSRNRWIGVPRWPYEGMIFQRRGTSRSGTAQKEFRDALTERGYFWAGYDADHVIDLQFGGEDSFYNVWPLDSGINQWAGTWHSGQGVSFSEPGDPTVRTKSIGTTELEGRYFVIKRIWRGL